VDLPNLVLIHWKSSGIQWQLVTKSGGVVSSVELWPSGLGIVDWMLSTGFGRARESEQLPFVWDWGYNGCSGWLQR
jgi:hypothetical protein